MTNRSLKFWDFVHKWSSLICTLFMLLLCITGLPLIFHEEIDHLFGPEFEAVPEGSPAPTLASIVARAAGQRPGEQALYLGFDRELPAMVVSTARSPLAAPDEFHYQFFDVRTGEQLDMPQPDEGFMHVLLRLHTDMFAGLAGMLFLGLMGMLLLVAILSGVVLYAPFMRRLDFGTVRTDRGRRLRWLDLHNLLGIITVVWLTVVGVTGVINTLSLPVQWTWQSNELRHMIGSQEGEPAPDSYAAVDDVVTAVRKERPDMQIASIAFPGTPFASPHHFGVYLTGNTPVTSRLLTPALVHAATGRLTAIGEMPLYVKVFFLSQPLHFGDYGGLPLKLAWAILDVLTIVVLITGVYLWFKKSRFARGAEREELAAEPEMEEALS